MAWNTTLRHSDFHWESARPCGLGAVSRVHIVKYNEDGEEYAIKAVSKSDLVANNKVEAAFNEKNLLKDVLSCPFVATLYGTFQTEEDVYFVLEYCPLGQLDMLLLSNQGHPLPKAVVIQVVAEVVLGLEAIHRKGWVHRDLKPENICFQSDGRCVLIDFDTAVKSTAVPIDNHGVAVKSIREQSEADRNRRFTVSEIQAIRRKTQQFVGTAQFVSPEMLGSADFSYASDLWALGCIAFQMGTGVPCFDGASPLDMFHKIVKGKVDYPASMDDDVKDLCQRLLKINPVERLGTAFSPTSPDYLSDLKAHRLFAPCGEVEKGIDWEALGEQRQCWLPCHSRPVLTECRRAPVEDKEYIEKMVNATTEDPFRPWGQGACTDSGHPPSTAPVADTGLHTAEGEQASDDEMEITGDVPTAAFEPYTFPLSPSADLS